MSARAPFVAAVVCAAAVIVALWPAVAQADLARSPVPVPRPGGDIVSPPPVPADAASMAQRPLPRPGSATLPLSASAYVPQGMIASPRPTHRPDRGADRAQQAALAPAPSAPKAASFAGSVCGVAAIKGTRVGSVPGAGACGIEEAVKVTSVAGVGLSSAATIDCATAKALNTWVETSAKPALARNGSSLSKLLIAGSYACRGRNNVKGAKLSEHAKGHAVDIAGFALTAGKPLSVLKDWHSPAGAVLKEMHKGACGPFGTVLGPDANAAHKDHFHFDTARYRSGSYCR
ncbi:hypothetical protein AQS8620_00508 [Aquimixticola soesokkakensis]|uniref:Extensin-like C-terminal domain-containing protein n=1 Tax=Aquimixticola soesokkakensis TaxID=1519096 RepID=A0A1Y5RM12_9RHOB|nr:extensin family protein [Aquimixticola soesokkakensis]SLN20274.1 hypothetical protein AQS8620_00508 [Aquimixticola soesokkakensis]